MLQDIALLIVFLPLFFLNVLAPLLILKTQRLPARVGLHRCRRHLRARVRRFPNCRGCRTETDGICLLRLVNDEDTHTETFFCCTACRVKPRARCW